MDSLKVSKLENTFDCKKRDLPKGANKIERKKDWIVGEVQRVRSTNEE